MTFQRERGKEFGDLEGKDVVHKNSLGSESR